MLCCFARLLEPSDQFLATDDAFVEQHICQDGERPHLACE
jgi:hypothetical protein